MGTHDHPTCSTRSPTCAALALAPGIAPADALELQELRALAAYRARQARGEDAGVPHGEAFRRVFGGAEA